MQTSLVYDKSPMFAKGEVHIDGLDQQGQDTYFAMLGIPPVT